MSDRIPFAVHATDGAARTGELVLPRGIIRTPAFMPIGTAGTVKAMYLDQVRALGTDIILGNTYHLMLRPGAERVATECEIVNADTSLACTAPPGAGRGLRVRVTVGGQRSAPSDALGTGTLDYARPRLDAPAEADAPPTRGGTLLLSGAELGGGLGPGGIEARWANARLDILAVGEAWLEVAVPSGLPSPATLAVAHVVRAPSRQEVQRVHSAAVAVAYASPRLSCRRSRRARAVRVRPRHREEGRLAHASAPRERLSVPWTRPVPAARRRSAARWSRTWRRPCAAGVRSWSAAARTRAPPHAPR